MNRIIYYIIIIGIVFFSYSRAFAQGLNTPVITGGQSFNTPVSNSASTVVITLALGQGALGWTIHPEGASIRCVTKIPNITHACSSSIGIELYQNGYYTSEQLNINPTLEFDCCAEGGSPVPTSGYVGTK